MEKPHNFDDELGKLLIRAENVEIKAKLDIETAVFFDNQAKKLEMILDHPLTSEKQKQDAMKNLETLYGRIQKELNGLNENGSEMEKIEAEFLALFNKRWL